MSKKPEPDGSGFLMKSLRETVIPLSAFGHFPLGGSKGLLLASPHGGGGRAACGEVGRGSFSYFLVYTVICFSTPLQFTVRVRGPGSCFRQSTVQ